MTVVTERDSKLDHFLDLRSPLADVPEWVNRMREEGREQFAALGFPTTRQEAWKYTSVNPIAATRFHPAANTADRLGAAVAAPHRLPDAAMELVFVNGHFSKPLSTVGELPSGALVGSLAGSFGEADVERHLGSLGNAAEEPFVALNNSLVTDGAVIRIPDGVAIEGAIHLLFISVPEEEPVLNTHRILVIAGRNSQASIVESWVGAADGTVFNNVVTEIIAADNAVIDHTKLQMETPGVFHLASIDQRQGRSSSYTHHSISVGAGLARNDIRAVLDGEGGDCVLNGLYLLDGDQHLDNETVIDHAKPHCTSRELYKGILDGRSHGIFQGRIIVRPDAQKTNARQTNNNLILSANAIANTTPQLEIYADDVKCNHGSTIGRLDDSAMFYLRSRGIPLEEAREILTYGFASEIVAHIGVKAVRERLQDMLLSRLPSPVGREERA